MFTTLPADFFKPGDKVTLGNGEEGVVKKHVVSPTGFHSYRVTTSDGRVVPATAAAMQRRASRCAAAVVAEGRVFNCRVARSPQEHVQGLQGSTPLASDEGLLFVFDHPRAATFHMGSVSFPIDIAFGEGERVARVVRDAQPGSRERWSHDRTSWVLETAAGHAPAVGARVDIQACTKREALGMSPTLTLGDPEYDPNRVEQHRDDRPTGGESHKVFFPREYVEDPSEPDRYSNVGTPDEVDPNADQMSNKHWVDRAPYNPLGDSPATAPFRPSAQLQVDPADLIVGLIQGMTREARPLDWHRDALDHNVVYAVVDASDIASWLGNLRMSGSVSSDILDALTSSQGMQLLGDGMVLAGLADIANVATQDDGSHALVLWAEYVDIKDQTQ